MDRQTVQISNGAPGGQRGFQARFRRSLAVALAAVMLLPAMVAMAIELPATRQSAVNGRVIYETAHAGIIMDTGRGAAPALAQFVITAGEQPGQTSLLGRSLALPGYFMNGAAEVPWTTLIASSNPFSLGNGCAVGTGGTVLVPYIHNFLPHAIRIENGQFNLLALTVPAGSYQGIDCASGAHGTYFSLMHANSAQVHLYRWTGSNVSRIDGADVAGVISGFGGGYVRPSLAALQAPGPDVLGIDRLSVLALLTNGTTSLSVFDSDSHDGSAVWIQSCALFNRPPPIGFTRPNEASLVVSSLPGGMGNYRLAATPDPSSTEIRLFQWQGSCATAPNIATGVHVGTGAYGWSGISGIGWQDGTAQFRLSDRYVLWPGGPALPSVHPVPPAGDGPVSACGVTRNRQPRRTLNVRAVAGGLQVVTEFDRVPQLVFDSGFDDAVGAGAWPNEPGICSSTFNF